MYAEWTDEVLPPHLASVTRIVNNQPARPLAQCERDGAVDAALARVVARCRPTILHVHHLQFLSAGLRPPPGVAVVGTLHDQWAWCAAGGVGLLPDGRRCEGPEPDLCAACGAAWAPVPGRRARALTGVAAGLARWVSPERLHRLYQGLPDRLRAPVRRGRRVDEGAAAAVARNQALLDCFRSMHAVISPSRFLAERAAEQGLEGVVHVPHGVDPVEVSGGEPSPDAPLLFLGTIAAHKGPDRVVRAWRRAFPSGRPGLRVHGPVQDPALLLGHPAGEVLDRAGVAAALRGARALVVGSTWHENAPMVILEARSQGCPVIAPRLGGMPELVEHGVDGWLVEPDDEDALVEALHEAAQRRPCPRPARSQAQLVEQTLEVYRLALSRMTC
jgi:glycosyltransferase involved in cell wall biosynthesis